MNTNERIDRIVTEIDELGDSICCYAGGVWPETRRCDCKYQSGANADKPFGSGGEVTGCPEEGGVIPT